MNTTTTWTPANTFAELQTWIADANDATEGDAFKLQERLVTAYREVHDCRTDDGLVRVVLEHGDEQVTVYEMTGNQTIITETVFRGLHSPTRAAHILAFLETVVGLND